MHRLPLCSKAGPELAAAMAARSTLAALAGSGGDGGEGPDSDDEGGGSQVSVAFD
jgi:hypothetical protein